MSIDNAQPGCDCPTCQIARAAPSPALTREALAAALHDEFWDETVAHSTEGERSCGDLEAGSVERIFASLGTPPPAPTSTREET